MDLVKKVDINGLKHNANRIIPSYCYLPVSWRSLVDLYGFPESYKPQIYTHFEIVSGQFQEIKRAIMDNLISKLEFLKYDNIGTVHITAQYNHPLA